MAVVKGVKEKVHLPLYDSIFVKPGKQLREILTSNVVRFFQDVTGKTKLLTNMQTSSLLPHWNTFEARAMRVVISDLPAQFPKDPPANSKDLPVMELDATTGIPTSTAKTAFLKEVLLAAYVELRRDVEASPDKKIRVFCGEFGLTTTTETALIPTDFVIVGRDELDDLAENFNNTQRGVLPPEEQILPNNGFGTLIGKFIYNSVTTFFVGEKIMIQVPTWFFPAGAGPYSEDGRVTTHGEPSPEATFRFAEPIFIDTQQNFRVEIEIPEGDVLSEIQKLYGPFFIWVVLDGYMTRDVQ